MESLETKWAVVPSNLLTAGNIGGQRFLEKKFVSDAKLFPCYTFKVCVGANPATSRSRRNKRRFDVLPWDDLRKIFLGS
jgi:hypothetical protein